MKVVYLIRHAKSGWGEPGLADFDRTLNGRGLHDAPQMGQRLKALNVRPNLIVSSPAKRAITTARLIAEALGYDRDEIVEDDVLYSAFPEDTLKIIRTTPDSAESVMIFGHNPTMTDLVNRMSDFGVDNVPTCGAFCARFDVEEWEDVAEGRGEVVFFEFPKLVG